MKINFFLKKVIFTKKITNQHIKNLSLIITFSKSRNKHILNPTKTNHVTQKTNFVQTL